MRHFATVHHPSSAFEGSSILAACLASLFATAMATAQVGPSGGQAPVGPTLQAAAAQARPVIHVDKADHDFGDVWVGDDVEHTFTITNKGDTTLEIRRVSVDCGCTSIGDHPKTLEPGQSGQFPFGLRSATLNGKIAPKKVVIHSNDPGTPELTLQLGGTFKKRIEISPGLASFGTLITPEPVQQTLTIRNNTETPLELTLQPVLSKQFKVELVETQPGKVFTIAFTTIVPYEPGFLNLVAVLETNVEAEKTIRIQAVGRVPGRLDLDPLVAQFAPNRRAPGQDHSTMHFWLNNYGASLVNVKKATVDDPSIKATVDCRSPGKSFRVQVDVPASTVIPPEGRFLTIETDDPDMPKLQAKIVSPAAQPKADAQQPSNTQAQADAPPAAPIIRPAERLVGQSAPEFSLETFDHKSLATPAIRDSVTVLNFVSPTCPACKKQIPDLEKVREAYQPKGVRFVNVVNMNPSRQREFTQAEVSEIMSGLNSRLELAADLERRVGNGFQITHYPTCVLLGKDGKIAAVHIGSGKTAEVSRQLDTLLAGNVPAPAAAPAN